MISKRGIVQALLAFGTLVAATARADTIRFKTVSIKDRDEMIGGEAFSLLVPSDWRVDGGVVWRLHPTMPATIVLRAHPVRGLEQLEFFPSLAFVYGDGLGPDTEFPVGASYLGNEVRPALRDAIDCLKQIVFPRFRFNTGAKLARDEALPKLGNAGRVRLAYEVNEQPVEEDLYCVLSNTSLPVSNMTFQVADHIVGVRAAKGQLDRQMKVFQTVINSVQMTLPWYARYVQTCQALTPDQLQQIHAASELGRIISKTTNDITGEIRQSYEQRQASEDRVHSAWNQMTHAVDEYSNPADGRTVELPAGNRAAWANTNGEYVVTDRTDFVPASKYGGSWQKLERKGD